METAAAFIKLSIEAGRLAADLLGALDRGESPRVEAVLSIVSPSEMTQRLKDARAALKYGSPR